MIHPEKEFLHYNENQEYFISDDLTYFKGHFPGNPILPGVAIVDLCQFHLEKREKKKLNLQEVVNAKFLKTILPGMYLSIVVTPVQGKENLWHFLIQEKAQTLADLTLCFKEQ